MALPKILVIDDEFDVVEAISFQISSFAQPIKCSDSLAAIDILKREEIDLVLSDYIMPMNGLSIAHYIQSHFTDLPIILFTAYATKDFVLESLNKDVFRVIEKPLNKNSLIKTVKEGLERRRQLKEQNTIKNKIDVNTLIHELNSPLARLQMRTQKLKEDFKQVQNIDSLRLSIDKINSCASKAVNTLNAVDTLRFMSSNPKKFSFSLLKLIQEICDELITEDIIIQNPSHIDQINTNKEYLSIILKNLILNAISFRDEFSPVIIKIYESQFKLEIEIQDYGIGVDEKMKEKIFKPLMTTNRSDKNLGMGLSIAQKAAKILGSEIVIKSLSAPTIFSFKLDCLNYEKSHILTY